MKPADALSSNDKIDGETISGARDFIGTPGLVEIKFNSRYSHFVAVIKFILLGLAILLVGLAFVLPNLEKEEGFTLDYANVTLSDNGLTMKNPQYMASDLSDRHYMVTADSATQKDATGSEVILKNLQADITLKSGDWISLSAPRGELNTETGLLRLFGKINIFSDSGNELTAQSAEVDLKNHTIVSTNPMKGHGPLGAIEADSVKGSQETGFLRFEGNVKVTINP